MKNQILFFTFTALAVAHLANAQLVFQQEQIEHTAGLLDETSEAVFKFTNTSEETIVIKDMRSSCGCTVPKLDKNEYRPGESGEIRALFTFGARVGTQMKRISVQTEGAGNRSYELNMVTHIPEWVQIEPRILRWKVGAPPAPQQFRVKVADPGTISLDAAVDLKAFDVRRDAQGANVTVFTVTPKTVTERATEFLAISVTATENGVTRSRPFGVHCLIR